MGTASSHQQGSLQPLVVHFFTTRSNSFVFFTTCSNFYSFYGKSSLIFMYPSSFLQFTTFIGFFFHFHMFKFTPLIHYPHSLFFFSFSCFHVHSSNSLSSFTIYFFNLPPSKLLLLMNYFHFFAFARVGFFML